MDRTLRQFAENGGVLAAMVPGRRVGRGDRVPEGCLAVAVRGDRAGELRRPGQPLPSRVAPDDAEPADAVVLARNRLWTVRFEDLELASEDRYRAWCRLTVQVRPVAESAELASIGRRLLAGRARLLGADLEQWMSGPVPAALRDLAGRMKLATLIEQLTADAAGSAIGQRLGGALFQCGLELAGIADFAVFSDDYDRQRRAERQAAMAGQLGRLEDELARQRSARHSAELDRLAGVLDRLAELGAKLEPSDDDPHARARRLGRLLERLAPSDREAFAAGTLQLPDSNADAGSARPVLLVAAGHAIYRLGPGSPTAEPLAGCESLSDRIGPLRSLVADGGRLLVGGRDGVAVLRLDPVRPGGESDQLEGRASSRPPTVEVEAVLPLSPGPRRRAGVNAACLLDGPPRLLLATHSEVGLLRWSLDGPDAPADLLLPADGQPVRAVGRCPDGRVVLAADRSVLAFDPHSGEFAPRTLLRTAAPITALAADDRDLFVGAEDGAVWQVELSDNPFDSMGGVPSAVDPPPARRLVRLGGPIGSIQPILLGWLSRLLVSAGPGGLVLCQPQLAAVAGVGTGEVGVRQAAFAAGWLAALSARRDRLLLFAPGRLDRPAETIDLRRQLGHSIQTVLPLAVHH